MRCIVVVWKLSLLPRNALHCSCVGTSFGYNKLYTYEHAPSRNGDTSSEDGVWCPCGEIDNNNDDHYCYHHYYYCCYCCCCYYYYFLSHTRNPLNLRNELVSAHIALM